LSRALSPDEHCAAMSTWLDADPVSLALRYALPMLADTCWVPCAAR
jgi:hypothetical protein